MTQPNFQELKNKLGTPDEAFYTWRDAMSDKYWKHFDLSALRIGYELGKALQASSDAERLAEALRELVSSACMDEERFGESGDEKVERILAEWQAAHSAKAQPPANQDKPVYAISRSMHSYYTQDEEEARQAEFDGANVQRIPAQPPAASVTDAMVNRLTCWMIAQFGECRAPADHKARIEWWGNQARSALAAALAAQENPNG